MLHSVSGLGSWVIQDLFYKYHLPDLEQGSEETLSSPKSVQSFLQVFYFL